MFVLSLTAEGMGGSGSSFLSKTPDEFLSNVSEMEATDGGQLRDVVPTFNTCFFISFWTHLCENSDLNFDFFQRQKETCIICCSTFMCL